MQSLGPQDRFPQGRFGRGAVSPFQQEFPQSDLRRDAILKKLGAAKIGCSGPALNGEGFLIVQ